MATAAVENEDVEEDVKEEEDESKRSTPYLPPPFPPPTFLSLSLSLSLFHKTWCRPLTVRLQRAPKQQLLLLILLRLRRPQIENVYVVRARVCVFVCGPSARR